jgi:ATP-dependent RNA helicase
MEFRRLPEKRHLDKLLQDVVFRSTDDVEIVPTFEKMDLKKELLRGITEYGFKDPSAIQKRAIMPIIKEHDVIAQAQSGTGKTATFGIGILQGLDTKINLTQALILSPTRELAVQTKEIIEQIGRYMDVKAHACIGGTSIGQDIAMLKAGQHVISGTPGRVIDMIINRYLSTKNLKFLVFDEADKLMDEGFHDDLYNIFKHIMPDVQVILVSATMPHEVLEVAHTFMTSPIRILVKRDELALQNIKQFFVSFEREDAKLDVLMDLYETLVVTQSVVFCRTRANVDQLAERLRQKGFTVLSIHGKMLQAERDDVMKDFRAGKHHVLITTDLCARGLDIPAISLVINYEMPREREDYINRIGRSGRYERKGVAISFALREEIHILHDIEQFYSLVIDEMPMDVVDSQ